MKKKKEMIYIGVMGHHIMESANGKTNNFQLNSLSSLSAFLRLKEWLLGDTHFQVFFFFFFNVQLN